MSEHEDDFIGNTEELWTCHLERGICTRQADECPLIIGSIVPAMLRTNTRQCRPFPVTSPQPLLLSCLGHSLWQLRGRPMMIQNPKNANVEAVEAALGCGPHGPGGQRREGSSR